ncbi:MAG: HupE/UreJ family protein [Deltaproteobacteria bacterium]|nr:HupE/UreJ family protein [Deltaproteobacteria bacterium]
MRYGSAALRIAFALPALVLACAAPAAAHQADTSYLDVAVGSEAIDAKVVLDLHVLRRIVDLDADGDHRIDAGEREHAGRAVQSYLAKRIELSLDGGAPSLGEPLAPVWPPKIESVRERSFPQTLVAFPFRRPLAAYPELLTVSLAVWPELGPSHTNLTHVREEGREELEIVFTEAEPDFDYFTEAPPSRLRQFGQFVILGVQHIYGGLDHVLFLIGLLVVSRLRELIGIVSSFTVAHSITLAVAGLGLVQLPSRWIEVAIALTIVWIAVENLWRSGHAARWRLTFAFGLVHGFGFAGVLRELDLSSSGLMRSLAGFNVGVELGQIALVLACYPVFALLGRTRYGTIAAKGVSLAVGVAGLAWLVERTRLLS